MLAVKKNHCHGEYSSIELTLCKKQKVGGEPYGTSDDKDKYGDKIGKSAKDELNPWQAAAEIIDEFSFCFVFVVLLILVLGTSITGMIWQLYVLPNQEERALMGEPCPQRY